MGAGRGSLSPQEQLEQIRHAIERINGHVQSKITYGDIKVAQRRNFLDDRASFPNEEAKLTFTTRIQTQVDAFNLALDELKTLRVRIQETLNEITTLTETPAAISAENIRTKQSELDRLDQEFLSKRDALNRPQRTYEQIQQIQSLTLHPDAAIQRFEIEHLNELADAANANAVRQELNQINKALPAEQDRRDPYKLQGIDLTTTIPEGDHTNDEIVITDGAAIEIQRLARIKHNLLNAEIRAANAQKILREINAFNPAPENPQNRLNTLNALNKLDELGRQNNNDLQKLDFIEDNKALFGISETSSMESIRGMRLEISAIFTALETKRITLNAAQIQANIGSLIVAADGTPANRKAVLDALNTLTRPNTDLKTFNDRLTNNRRRLGIADECNPNLLEEPHKIALTASLAARKKAFTIAVMQDGLASLPPEMLANPLLPGVLAELSSAGTPVEQKKQLLNLNNNKLLLGIDAACDIAEFGEEDITTFTDSGIFKGRHAHVFKIQVINALNTIANSQDPAQQKQALALFNGIEEAAGDVITVRTLLNTNRGLLGIQQDITPALLTDVAARQLHAQRDFVQRQVELNNTQLIRQVEAHDPAPADLDRLINALLSIVIPTPISEDRREAAINPVKQQLNVNPQLFGINQDPMPQIDPNKLDYSAIVELVRVVKLKIPGLQKNKILAQINNLVADPNNMATTQHILSALTALSDANSADEINRLLQDRDVNQTLQLGLNLDTLERNRIGPIPNFLADANQIKNDALTKKVELAIPYIETFIQRIPDINLLLPVANARNEIDLRGSIETLCRFNTNGLPLNELETLQTEAITKLGDSQPYYALMLKAPINSPLQQALDLPGVKAAIEAYARTLAPPADTRLFIDTLTNPTSTKAEITAALERTSQFGAGHVDPAPLAQQLFAENQLGRLLEDATLPRDVKQELARRRGDGAADNQVLHKLGEKATPDDVNRLIRQLKEAQHSEVMVPALRNLGLEATAAIAQNRLDHGKVFSLLNANPFIAELLTKVIEAREPAGNLNLLYIRDHENAILARIGGLSAETIKQLIKNVENSNRADLVTNLSELGIDLAQLTNPIVPDNVRKQKIAALYAEKEYHRITELVGPAFKTVLHNHRADVVEKFKDLDTIIEPNAADVVNTNKHLLSLFNAKNENDFRINCAHILNIPIADPDLSKVWKESKTLHTKTNLSQERMAQYSKLITTYTVIAHQGYKSQWDHKKITGIKTNLDIIKTGLSKQKLQLQISINGISNTYQRLTGKRTKLEKRLFEVDTLLAEIKTTQTALEKIPAILAELKLSEGSTQSEIIKPADVPPGHTLQQTMVAKETAWRNPPAPGAPGAPAVPVANAGRNMASILDTADEKTVGLLKDGEGRVSEFKTLSRAIGQPLRLTTYTFTTIDTTKNECKTEIRLPFGDFNPANYPPQKIGFFGSVTLPHPAILEAAAGWVDEHLQINPFHGQLIKLSGSAFKPDELTAIIITLQLRLVPEHLIQLVDTVTIKEVTQKQVDAAQQQVNKEKFKLFDKLDRLSEKETTQRENLAHLSNTTKKGGGGRQSP